MYNHLRDTTLGEYLTVFSRSQPLKTSTMDRIDASIDGFICLKVMVIGHNGERPRLNGCKGENPEQWILAGHGLPPEPNSTRWNGRWTP